MATAEELRTQQKDLWGAAAPGWDRRFEWFERQTEALTARMCDAAGIGPGMVVLDLACGSGQPALTVARRVRPGGRVVATDLSPDMVEVTARRAAGLDVETREMGAEAIDFDDGTFDAVTCRFGLMFCPDPARAASEIRRVLRPGRRCAVVVWDVPERNPFFMTIARALAAIAQMPPVDPTVPGVFHLSLPGELERALRAGGLADVAVEPMPMVLDYGTLDEYWDIQTDIAAPLRAAIRTMDDAAIARLRQAVFAELEPHLDGGRVRLGAVPLVATGSR